MEEGISLFSSLLNNKHFLIVFVHALEQQKDFAVRDRSGCKALGEGQGPHSLSWLGLARPKAGQFANHLACQAVGIHPAPGPHVLSVPGPGCPSYGLRDMVVAGMFKKVALCPGGFELHSHSSARHQPHRHTWGHQVHKAAVEPHTHAPHIPGP